MRLQDMDKRGLLRLYFEGFPRRNAFEWEIDHCGEGMKSENDRAHHPIDVYVADNAQSAV